jgi:hypothetical protein
MSDIFDRWQEKYGSEPLFRDGVLSQEDWDNAHPKILFLLKESYGDWFEVNGPIPIKSGNNKQFFPNIALWKYLVSHYLNTKVLPPFPSSLELLPEFQNGDGCLKEIAYVNVKKKLGTSISNSKEIQHFALRDKELLAEQMDMLNPDVVICCGTFWSYHPIYDGNKTIVPISKRIYKHGSRMIIDFYHPGYYAFRGGQSGLYDKLKELLSYTKDPLL